MGIQGAALTPKKRLDSWKEIAAFFDRDERTVKRWEKERGLPVHRLPGNIRGGVFAYSEELAEWLQAPNASAGAGVRSSSSANRSEDSETSRQEFSENMAPPQEAMQFDARGKIATSLIVTPSTKPDDASTVTASRLEAAKSFFWIAPLAVIVFSFFAFSFGHREPQFKNALAAPHQPPAEAQDLYLKGRYYFEKRTPADLSHAVDFFTQAIVHDPGYAAAYVGLADTYNLLREYSAMTPQEAFPRALAAAKKAVELDPNLAEAHNSLAFATFWGTFDAVTAEHEFKRALELDPTLPRAHHWYATFLVELGRSSEALTEIERARQLDPSSTPILADKGFILAVAGQKEEARTLLSQIAMSQPDFVHPHQYLAEQIYFPEGNYAGYFQEKKILARLRHDPAAERNVEREEKSYARGGLDALLQARLATAQQSFNRGNGSAFDLAEAHAALGENYLALKYLDIACQRHDLSLATLPLSTAFQSLRPTTEFRELVAKVGLPPIN